MPKRRSDEDFTDEHRQKRICTVEIGNIDRLSSLSDELLIHILSFLPIPSLITCQSLSHRFHALAGDSELWKRQYYSRWVRPRARRLANARRAIIPSSKAEYSPKVSTWLDHSHLASNGRTTNWKRQYRLKNNWSKGLCRVTEVEFPQPSRPPILVKFCAGIVLTADSDFGLRAWVAENPKNCIARVSFSESRSKTTSVPTALAAIRGLDSNSVDIAVGFQNGHFSLFKLDLKTTLLDVWFTNTGSVDGAITAIASSSEYLLTISHHKSLSLYQVPSECNDSVESSLHKGPRLLASLRADSIVAPISLCIRVVHSEIIASIVYSFFHLGCGWSLGIQELRLDKNGQQLGSRLATTVDSQYGVQSPHSLVHPRRTSASDETAQNELLTVPSGPTILHQNPPTSMSYSHPYLLTSHADNTLTMYLVVSTSGRLFVKSGRRLWGHTSSVSAVQVSDRGKAVSVSSRGDEIRIWELETILSSPFGAQKALKEESSIQISPENSSCEKHEGAGILPGIVSSGLAETRLSSSNISERLVHMRGCVGFDDERVLLLREREIGTQLLECYDFT